MRRALGQILLVLLAVPVLAPRADAASRAIFTLADPRGDDHGDGSLVYPRRDDMGPGDLDLVSLVAREEKDGTTFEATFARPIRKPDRRTIDLGGGSLEDYARFGFYTFNLDVYVDTDHTENSGNLVTLPGRVAQMEPKNAWEKAICLTPRPHLARADLKRIFTRHFKKELKAEKGKVEPAEVAKAKASIDKELDDQVFFPTRIHVTGPTITFFVPSSFLGGPAKKEWGYVVVVTGAQIDKRADVGGLVGVTAPDPDNLMVFPVGNGPSSDHFGTDREDPLQTPIVDLAVPPGKTQEEILKDDDPKAGRPPRLPAVIPADVR